VNTYPELTENRIVPMAFQVGAETEYTIFASGLQSFDDNVLIYLEDKQEGITIDLNIQSEYTFMASPEDEGERFNVHFLKSSADVEEMQPSQFTIFQDKKSLKNLFRTFH
jgi:hypothetical protein